MTREEIAALAHDAGIRIASVSDTVDARNVYLHDLVRFATLVAAAECAPLANEIEALRQDGSKLAAANKEFREALLEIIESPSVFDHYRIARAAIRARGQA